MLPIERTQPGRWNLYIPEAAPETRHGRPPTFIGRGLLINSINKYSLSFFPEPGSRDLATNKAAQWGPDSSCQPLFSYTGDRDGVPSLAGSEAGLGAPPSPSAEPSRGTCLVSGAPWQQLA